MNFNKICVYDWETDGTNPHECNPVQLGAVIIDPRKLAYIEGAEFVSDMRPPDIDDAGYFAAHKETIEWHARTQKCSVVDVLDRWRAAPDQKQVWDTFTKWLSKYHTKQARQSKFSAPIRAGYNIEDFDDIITKRLALKYGDLEKSGAFKMFHPRDRIDMLRMVWWWFENQMEPTSYTMDTMRQYLEMSSDRAHDALKDTHDEGDMLIQFLKTQRWLTEKLIVQGRIGKKVDNGGQVQV